MPQASRTSRFSVVFLTVFIDLAGFGLILPILPFYAQRFGAAGLGFGALIGVYSLMQFLSSQMLGRLSDRHGRRPVLLLTILFSAVGYMIFAQAGSYWVLFVARLISGFSGGNIAVAQAYVADVTTPAQRSRAMGLVGAAFGLGFVVGPALGGLAGHYGGPTAPAWVAVGLSLVNLVSAWYLLPESLDPAKRSRPRIFDLSHLRGALRHPRIGPLMGFWFIMPVAFSGFTVATPLYTAAQFGWRERELGLLFAVVGLTAAVVQGYAFGRLSHRFGDRSLLISGAFGMALGIALFPLLPTSATLYAGTFVLAFANSVAAPAASGLVSKFASVSEQGTMLGAAQAVSALGRLVGPVAVGQVYDLAGARPAFFAAATLMLVAGAASFRVGTPETVTPSVL